MMTAAFAFLFATWVPGLVINVVSSAVNRVIRCVCTMILYSFANNGNFSSPCNSRRVICGVRCPFAKPTQKNSSPLDLGRE
jgi:hypothetical protein